MGFALSTPEVGRASYASIFYDRVEKLSEEGNNVEAFRILGHGVAHEMGHLLLGTNSHTLAGLMRAHWGPDDLHRVALEVLRFTPQQAKLIRADVLARMKELLASQPSPAPPGE